MQEMTIVGVLLFLALCSVALAWVARRIAIPYPIVLVLGGNFLSFMPGLPRLEFDPQFLLVLVLPPILYQAALLTSWRDFTAHLNPIGRLAIGLVIVTTLVVGAALKLLVPGIPWGAAFTFGAIVSPPDAVAAMAILSRLGLSRRIVTTLEGESLVNDASGLVLYKFAVAATLSGTFSFLGASVDFATTVLGGIALGVVLGWIFVRVHLILKDPFVEVMTSLSIPYTAYVLAESVHFSGVLAVVAAGLLRGRHSPQIVSAESRIMSRSAWNILVFMLNSLVFILIGTHLSGVTEALDGSERVQLALYGVGLSLVAIGVRFGWVYFIEYLPVWLSRARTRSPHMPLEGEPFIVSWCGMRGIVSLAAALALPVGSDDQPAFPYRDMILYCTFVVITVTLVIQGLTLTPIVRRLISARDETSRDEEHRARVALARAALASLDREPDATPGSPPADRIRAHLHDRLSAFSSPATDSATAHAEATRLLRIAVKAEREELIRLWRAGAISDDVLHHLEKELDHGEAGL